MSQLSKPKKTDTEPISKVLEKTICDMDRRAASSQISGISCGFPAVDELINGFQKSNLIVIAARKGMGKTAFATSVIANISIVQQIPILLFYLEGTKELFVQRLLSNLGRFDSKLFKNGKLGDRDDTMRMSAAVSMLHSSQLEIVSSANLTLEQFVDICTQFSTKNNGNCLIFVDHIQLIRPSKTHQNYYEMLSEVAFHTKMLAQQLNIPIIVLSQLNRAVDTRVDRRPILCDLRDTGYLEDLADLVLFLYREQYYEPYNASSIAEIIISYQRHGPAGVAKLLFHPKYLCFDSITN